MCWEGGHFKEPSSPHLGGHIDSTPACSGSEQRPWLRGCPASDGERLTLRRSQSWRGTTLARAETRWHEAARSRASGDLGAGQWEQAHLEGLGKAIYQAKGKKHFNILNNQYNCFHPNISPVYPLVCCAVLSHSLVCDSL